MIRFPTRRLSIALLAQVVFCLMAAPVIAAQQWAVLPVAPKDGDNAPPDTGVTIQAAFDASNVRPEEVSDAEQKKGRSKGGIQRTGGGPTSTARHSCLTREAPLSLLPVLRERVRAFPDNLPGRPSPQPSPGVTGDGVRANVRALAGTARTCSAIGSASADALSRTLLHQDRVRQGTSYDGAFVHLAESASRSHSGARIFRARPSASVPLRFSRPARRSFSRASQGRSRLRSSRVPFFPFRVAIILDHRARLNGAGAIQPTFSGINPCHPSHPSIMAFD
jgi:hypothetical protein